MPVFVCYIGQVGALLSILLLAASPARALDDTAKARVTSPRRWALGWAAKKPELALAASDASGLPQLYSVDLKRNRWSQLTEEPAGRRRGALSPEGDSAVFLRDVMGSEIGQLFRTGARGGAGEALVPGFPAKSVVDASFGASGKNVYFDASDRSGFGVYQFALGGRRAFTLAFGRREIQGASPSDDERWLAYTARTAAGDLDVRVVDLASGGEAGSVASPGADDRHFAWAREAPFGRLLVAAEDGIRLRPGIFDVAAGSTTWLDPPIPGDVAALDWFPGGRELLIKQTDRGRTALWRWDPSASATRLNGVKGRVGWARVRPDGAVWANVESGERPPDVIDADGRLVLPAQGKRKPSPGRAARWVELSSSDGTPLDGWLVEPSTGAPPLGALLWLPDRSSDFAGDDWDPLRLALADEGYATLALNYRRPGPGTLAGELADVAAAREWLAGVAGSSIAVAGRFYGGTLALLALSRQPELWVGGAAVGAVADWERLYQDASEPVREWCRRLFGSEPEAAPERWAERSPAERAFTIRSPVLLAHAAHDSRAPITQMHAFDARLEDAGKPHRLLTLKGGQAELSAADQWLFLESFLNFLHQAGFPPGGR